MRIRAIVGKILYTVFGKHLPAAHCVVKPIGAACKTIRAWEGRMILEKCGGDQYIPKSSVFIQG